MKTKVLLAYPDGDDVTIPVELNAATTEVIEARGRPAPAFVFANADDHGYFITILDSASVDTLERRGPGDVSDPLLRTMLWGALWDLVRDARLDPARFATLAIRELAREKDEQIFPNLIGRVNRTLSAYLSSAARDSLEPKAETEFWREAHHTWHPYGVRRAYLDAFINVARSADAIARLRTLLTVNSVAGDPVRDPTRWDIVTRLMILGAPGARDELGRQARRDTTPDGRRRAFIAGAARRDSATKATYFDRYFSDASLNEDWASGSLSAFNAPEHAELTLPYLRPALDSLPFIQKNRRIFFLGNWLGAFIGGHRSGEALGIVNAYLAENPGLPLDLRRKVLQTVDELNRTVAILARWK
jgi:aminopeptidase N